MADLMTEEMNNLDKVELNGVCVSVCDSVCLSQHSSAVHEEQREMARLRYIHALSKVRMEKVSSISLLTRGSVYL